MRFFFFGTLMDAEVRELVIGRAIPPGAVQPATLAGFRTVYVAGQSYPMLTPHPPGRVEGCLVRGLDRDAGARIGYFEGVAYRRERHSVRVSGGARVDAYVFMARTGVRASERPWVLSTWQRRHKRAFLERARTWLEVGAPEEPPPSRKGSSARGHRARG